MVGTDAGVPKGGNRVYFGALMHRKAALASRPFSCVVQKVG